MSPGETISTVTLSASVYSGLDPNPGNLVTAANYILNGTQVNPLINEGLLGVIYEVSCTVLTSLSQTLKQSAFLAIIPDLT